MMRGAGKILILLLTLIVLGAVVGALAGCHPMQVEPTPRAQLEGFIDSANAALRGLSAMRAAGMLNRETIDAVDALVPILDAAIRLWDADIRAGEDPSASMLRAQRALDELINERIKALRKRNGGDGGHGRTRDSPNGVDPAEADRRAHPTTATLVFR